MTKYQPLVMLALVATSGGCPGDDGPTNPATVWIAPDGAETRLRLVPEEPAPF